MSWPITFGTLTSPVPASDLDLMFNQAAAGMAIPCSVVGTNALSLTPLANFPALTSYNELGGYRFRAATNSTGAVTAQYNGLGLLPVYHNDGVTQVSTGELVSGFEYVVRFSQSLNGGAGGFFLESPSTPVAATSNFSPGGRLTLVSGQPVMTATASAQSIIFYAPYVHAFCPVYNGTSVSMAQFTSSLSDNVGLSLNMAGSPATWPAGGIPIDMYLTLVAGVPTLCTIQWTNATTRAVTLAVFGGFLTNNASTTAQTAAGPITLQNHQGTFLGSFINGAAGLCSFIFGGAASGGSPASFGLCNYYNKVQNNTAVTDSGVAYTYSSAAGRNARASSNNRISFLQSDSEKAAIISSATSSAVVGVGGAFIETGIGAGITGFSTIFLASNSASVTQVAAACTVPLLMSGTGFLFAQAVEAGDGVNANTFDSGGNNTMTASIWL